MAAPPPISTSIAPQFPTANPFPTLPATTTKEHTTKHATSAVASPTAPSDNGGGGRSSISGGAVAGLVIGVLFILGCSITSGLFLLKKRRKRMMSASRGHGGQYTSPKYGNVNNNEDDGDAGQGGLSEFLSGLVAKARKAVNSARPSAPSRTTAAASGSASVPMQQHQARAVSPSFASGPGSAVSPAGSAGPSLPRGLDGGRMNTASPTPSFGPDASQYPNQQTLALYQSPPPVNFIPQQPPGPGYGGPGYGGPGYGGPAVGGQLVQLQQHQHQRQSSFPQQQQQTTLARGITAPASQPYYYQPGTGLVSAPLGLPPQQQQQQPVYQQPPPFQYTQQAYQQPVPVPAPNTGLYIVPAPFPPPSLPPAIEAFPSLSSTELPYISATNARSMTPESGSVFLPGDITRPLLSQGLFKIVPDAEDEEEARRLVVTTSADEGHNASASSSSVPPLNLNLESGFLDSFITYENQDQRFQDLEESRDGGNAKPRILLDKEEVVNEKQEFDEDGYEYEDEAVVIVGSDVVLEPLPSAKAAARTAAASASTSSTTTRDEEASSAQSLAHESQKSSAESLKVRLGRVATIGRELPTMGTEEYLERTDDKEEYSYGLHGDRRKLAGSSVGSTRPEVVHPPTRTSLGRGAQGDIVEANAESSSTSGSTEATPVSGTIVPPPIARSTKPKLAL